MNVATQRKWRNPPPQTALPHQVALRGHRTMSPTWLDIVAGNASRRRGHLESAGFATITTNSYKTKSCGRLLHQSISWTRPAHLTLARNASCIAMPRV